MVCAGCFEKQAEINRLQERIESLENKLNYQKKKAKQGYFGSSTPSSQKPFKESAENRAPGDKGGARKGHKGYGRQKFEHDEADEIREIKAEDTCPYCKHKGLETKKEVHRQVIEAVPVKTKRIIYAGKKQWCPHCRKTISPKPPILPRSLYGNQLIANSVNMHFMHGITLGKIENILEDAAVRGSLHNIFNKVADLFRNAIPRIIEDYRKEPVKQADETGWRTDGNNGYCWLFCSENTSIYEFTNTRSSRIPGRILGNKKLPGVLVVDRYAGYNKSPCRIQYCYAHLLRKLEDLGEEFIDDIEVQNFVSALAPLLSEAMGLRKRDISSKTYYKQAKELKKKIVKLIDLHASHSGIRNFQSIFRENRNRLYLWCTDRNIPADNNRSEREIRAVVIARKTSFGSQSERGASTRSVLMTILHTARKRLRGLSLEDWLKGVLDKIVENPKINVYSLLPSHSP